MTYQDQPEYERASKRIDETPELEEYRDIILFDWPEGAELWPWFAKADTQAIIAWCESRRSEEVLTRLEESIDETPDTVYRISSDPTDYGDEPDADGMALAAALKSALERHICYAGLTADVEIVPETVSHGNRSSGDPEIIEALASWLEPRWQDLLYPQSVVAAQLIRPWGGPCWIVEPVGDASDQDDIDFINDREWLIRASGDLRGWPPYTHIISVVDTADDLLTVDYLVQIER